MAEAAFDLQFDIHVVMVQNRFHPCFQVNICIFIFYIKQYNWGSNSCYKYVNSLKHYNCVCVPRPFTLGSGKNEKKVIRQHDCDWPCKSYDYKCQ